MNAPSRLHDIYFLAGVTPQTPLSKAAVTAQAARNVLYAVVAHIWQNPQPIMSKIETDLQEIPSYLALSYANTLAMTATDLGSLRGSTPFFPLAFFMPNGWLERSAALMALSSLPHAVLNYTLAAEKVREERAALATLPAEINAHRS